MVSPGSRKSLNPWAFALLLSVAVGLRAGQAAPSSGEWPGLWGPDRNARVAGPLKLEPDLELGEVWRRPLGKGFSEIAVSGGRGYTLFSDGQTDHLTAFDVATGKEVWRARLEATYRGHDGSDDGPISTPLVSDGRVFALDPFGRLFAFETATGRPLWKVDLPAELGAKAPWYGFATSPLPVGQLLVVQAGGAEKNNLVALDPATGKLVWSSHPAEKNGYSSPVLMTLAGSVQIVASTTDKIFGVNPKDGSVLWSHPSIGEPRQSPVAVPGDRILVMSYNESAILKVTSEAGAWKVQEVWKKPILKTNYSPTVYRDGYLYGMNGTYLVCVDPETGDVKWREKVYNASLILIDGHLAVLGEKSGNFQIIEATPEGFREKLRARVFTPGARSITGPVYVDGRFLLRNSEEMVMLELKKRQTGSTKEGK